MKTYKNIFALVIIVRWCIWDKILIFFVVNSDPFFERDDDGDILYHNTKSVVFLYTRVWESEPRCEPYAFSLRGYEC